MSRLLSSGVSRQAVLAACLLTVCGLCADAKIRVEECCGGVAATAPAVMFLSGPGGPGPKNIPYRDEVKRLSQNGYSVIVPYYLDVTHGSAADPQRHYAQWVTAIRETLSQIKQTNVAMVDIHWVHR